MQFFGLISLLVTVALIGWWFASTGPIVAPPSANPQALDETLDPVIVAHITEKAGLIKVRSPQPESHISSPLTITCQARGTWYFEGTFPVILTNWDGLIIAEGYATAQGEWMTEEFVPFVSTITFTSPYHAGDPEFMQRGSLILKKDNPSGLPEHDDALEFPIKFSLFEQAIPTRGETPSYNEMMDAANSAARSMER